MLLLQVPLVDFENHAKDRKDSGKDASGGDDCMPCDVQWDHLQIAMNVMFSVGVIFSPGW